MKISSVTYQRIYISLYREGRYSLKNLLIEIQRGLLLIHRCIWPNQAKFCDIVRKGPIPVLLN